MSCCDCADMAEKEGIPSRGEWLSFKYHMVSLDIIGNPCDFVTQLKLTLLPTVMLGQGRYNVDSNSQSQR